MLTVVVEQAVRDKLTEGLDEIVREGARRMLAAALEAEIEAYIATHAGDRDEHGRRLVVRNGHARALREVFPATREQRDWVHKLMNVLEALPTSAQSAARKALAQIRDAEDHRHAEQAVRSFAELFGAKYPKAVAKVVDDAERLLAFYDFPAEHWVHLKTSNPIESTFATVRLGTKVTKGRGSRAAGFAMVLS
jgi:transposase-like protein